MVIFRNFQLPITLRYVASIFPTEKGYPERNYQLFFSWSKPVKRRRDIIKYDLPLRSMTIEDNSSTALPKDQAVLCQDNTILSELNLNVSQQDGDLDNKENEDEIELDKISNRTI